MYIRVEISSLATPHQSGVSSYAKLLSEALARKHSGIIYGHYFNFLGRQPHPIISMKSINLERNSLIPLRVYAKLQSYNIAPPFDLSLPKVDLTIFPNFATWPTAKTRLTATTVHDLTYVYHPEFVEEKNLSHLQRVVPRSMHSADIILTVSQTVKNEIIDKFGVSESKIIVTHIPPDVIFKQQKTSAELKEIRNKYSIGPKKYILFLGNFEPRKNLSTLIAAYRLLPDSVRQEYQLVLAGGKGWKSKATQDVFDKAVEDGENIIHIGYVDSKDRPALYQSASLFAFPSIYEGFGIPILEAQYSGCPIVSADIPVLRETGGNAAIYADPTDPRKFSTAIQSGLINYPFTKKQMEHNANKFTWEKSIETLEVKTSQLLHSKPPKAQ